jgi:hypothetical protein
VENVVDVYLDFVSRVFVSRVFVPRNVFIIDLDLGFLRVTDVKVELVFLSVVTCLLLG